MALQNYTKPKFLLAEIPIKNNTFQDHRNWVYCVDALSLIEFIYVDDLQDFQFTGYQERFEYENEIDGELENFWAVFVQNNCEAAGQNQATVMQEAWQFYKEYLQWEDSRM